MTEQTAKLNYLHIAPRKMRAVANLIKGMPVNRAEAHLLLHRRRAAAPLIKLLRSAIANAKQRDIRMDNAYIKSIRVDKGPMLKRHLPRARGVATPIQKKMSHITIVLADGEIKNDEFTIIRPKKKLMTSQAVRKKQPKATEKPSGSAAPKETLGILKKVFRRKSI